MKIFVTNRDVELWIGEVISLAPIVTVLLILNHVFPQYPFWVGIIFVVARNRALYKLTKNTLREKGFADFFKENGTGDIIDLSDKSQIEKDVEIANHTTSRVGWRTSWLFSRLVLNLILIGALVLMYFNWKNLTIYGYVLYCIVIISLLAENSLMMIRSSTYSKHSTLKLLLNYNIQFQDVEKGSEKEESLTKLLLKLDSLVTSIISGDWKLD